MELAVGGPSSLGLTRSRSRSASTLDLPAPVGPLNASPSRQVALIEEQARARPSWWGSERSEGLAVGDIQSSELVRQTSAIETLVETPITEAPEREKDHAAAALSPSADERGKRPDDKKPVIPPDYPGSGTPDAPFVVNFTSNDRRNPYNWSPARRWFLCIVTALHVFAVSFTSSAFTGGLAEMTVYFEASSLVLTLGISLFLIGFACGPLFWAPIGEAFGRRPVFLGTYGAFVLFNLGCSFSKNIETLLVLRLLAGFFGSSPLANAGAVVADMFTAKDRGLALSVFTMMPFLGPVVGPIAGGFVGQYLGWRWCFRMITIFTACMFILTAVSLPETYAPIILRNRAAKLSKRTGKVYVSALDVDQVPAPFLRKLQMTIDRPFIMLIKEPICLLFALWAACVYGVLYAMFEAFPIVYQEQRGWKPGLGGCAFIGIGIGMFCGAMYNLRENKFYEVKLAEQGELPPEERLTVCLVGAPAVTVGLFGFAWSSLSSVHWSVSIILSSPFGFGMFLVFVGLQSYLVDTYLLYSASALAANCVLRSLFGAGFPLFTPSMYSNLGVQWATSTFAFISLVFVPVPFFFKRYGAKIRGLSSFAINRQLEQKLNKGEEKWVETP